MVWYKQREVIISILTVAIVSLLAGVVIGDANTKNNEPADKSNNSTQQTKSEPTVGTPKPIKPISLSGTGQAATEKFELLSGLGSAKLTSTGTGHFSVWLMDASSGENVELLANDSGQPFNGSKAFRIESKGQYLLDVSADNDATWTVEITQ